VRILFLSMEQVRYYRKENDKKILDPRNVEVAMAESIANLGNEVTLVIEKNPYVNDKKPDNINVIQMSLNDKINFTNMEILLSNKYDIVFCTSVAGAYIANSIAKKQNIPSVVQVLDVPVFRLKEIFVLMGFTEWKDNWTEYFKNLIKSSCIIANTTPTVNYLKNKFGKKIEDKLKLVYYATDTNYIDKISKSTKFNYDISFVSRLTFYKGCNFFLYALYRGDR